MRDQQRFIKIVGQMLLINQKDKEISNVEPKIDQLVYELYDLTPEVIEIVENSVNRVIILF